MIESVPLTDSDGRKRKRDSDETSEETQPLKKTQIEKPSKIKISHWPKNYETLDEEHLMNMTPERFRWLYDVEVYIQKSEKWLSIKKNHVSASEVASVLGLGSYQSREDMFNLKCNIIPPMYTSSAMLHGIKFEPVAAQLFTDSFGKPMIEFGFVEDRNYNFLGVSPDGFMIDDDSGICVEIKAPGRRRVHSVYSEEFIMERYPDYYHQVQMQAYVLGADKIKFVQYGVDPNPNHLNFPTFTINDINIDPDWIKKHEESLKEFWDGVLKYRKENPDWNSKIWTEEEKITYWSQE